MAGSFVEDDKLKGDLDLPSSEQALVAEDFSDDSGWGSDFFTCYHFFTKCKKLHKKA